MLYDAVIVGGGMAGLTAAAYLSQSGRSVLLCEKEEQLGGLVSSFPFNGFTFDGGIRAIENSGIIMPMLRQLGIEIDFVKSPVSIGIGDDIVRIHSEESLVDYQNMLSRQFPENVADIRKIMQDIRRMMDYMDVLYGIDNPLFMDVSKDRDYLLKTLLPWLWKYLFTINKIQKLDTPVVEYLKKFTDNPVLIDIIAQHFFQKTPAFFAMSYFSLYLDYQYPKGGTGILVDHLVEFIRKHQGEIRTRTSIISVDPQSRQIVADNGDRFSYRKLIWAADTKKLYSFLDVDALHDQSTRNLVQKKKDQVKDKIGADSVLTVYMTLDMDPSYFENISSAHFFYTPQKIGLSTLPFDDLYVYPDQGGNLTEEKEIIEDWLARFYERTTYEISFPVMRDSSLAPEGKTGLIVSTLFEHSLVKHISESGWYDEFKDNAQLTILKILDESVFPGIQAKVMDLFTSTPLTMESRTANSEGAITGWAFTNPTIPAVSKMTKIARSPLTPIPDVYQAGQWTFSPSGLPISVLTGKMAADRVSKDLK